MFSEIQTFFKLGICNCLPFRRLFKTSLFFQIFHAEPNTGLAGFNLTFQCHMSFTGTVPLFFCLLSLACPVVILFFRENQIFICRCRNSSIFIFSIQIFLFLMNRILKPFLVTLKFFNAFRNFFCQCTVSGFQSCRICDFFLFQHICFCIICKFLYFFLKTRYLLLTIPDLHLKSGFLLTQFFDRSHQCILTSGELFLILLKS